MRYIAASLLSSFTLFNVVVATFGKHECTTHHSDGSTSGDDSLCFIAGFLKTGCCAKDSKSSSWWCGTPGATCSSHSDCDGGWCDEHEGKCHGDYNEPCWGDDTMCGGELTCSGHDTSPESPDTCGGHGSSCCSDSDPWSQHSHQKCASGYCSKWTKKCEHKAHHEGDYCNHKDKCGKNKHGQKLVCKKHKCVLPEEPCITPIPEPSKHYRRSIPINRCPEGYSYCSVEGGAMACVDTSSNLDHCGRCDNSCSDVVGVDRSACVSSACEVWACSFGYVWSPSDQACVII